VDAHVTGDVEVYDATVSSFLARDPVRNTVLLTILGQLRSGGSFGDEEPWFAWASDGDDVTGAALRTPPYKVALSGMSASTATALGADLADRDMPGAFGDLDTVSAFAAGAGRSLRVGIRELQYVLTDLQPPLPVAGHARPYREDDADRYVAWMDGFIDETGVMRGGDELSSLHSRLRSGGALWFWEVDGEAVAMCSRSGLVCGVPRIGPVWTPAEHRKRGYAAAITAWACAQAFEVGAEACTLFADAANPTANGVYERLGFRRVAETVEADFSLA